MEQLHSVRGNQCQAEQGSEEAYSVDEVATIVVGVVVAIGEFERRNHQVMEATF